MNRQYWKSGLLKNIFFLSFIAAMVFFSCNKSSEKPEENLSPLDQKDSTESADTSSVVLSGNGELPHSAPPREAEEKPIPVPVPESVVPVQVRRPQQGEAPRFPEDIIIGTLGQGEVSAPSYRFAQSFLSALLREESRGETLSHLPPDKRERIIGILQKLDPEKVRVGGGKEDPDGSVSFLLRFIGQNGWSGGEVYIRQNEGAWNLEDFILDDPEGQNQTDSPYRFDLSPYERFF